MSELDIFEDEFPESEEGEIVEEAAEATEETAEETPETEAETKTEEAETDKSKVATPAADNEPWTLKAVLDERENVRKARDEADQLRKELEKLKPKQDDVSIFEDEKAFKDDINQKIAQAERNALFNFSEATVKREFGSEKLDAAKQWYKDDGIKSPYVYNLIQQSDDPYRDLIEKYDADQMMRNPESYKARLKEEILAELAKKPKPSTPSLASKRSVSGEATDSDDDFLKD